jgi:DNA-binding transcriptional LysR family regulator
MRNATLRQLKVFEAVARLLSFSRAAEELHLSQPAVSTAVSQLEDHAGLPLFDHIGRRVFLTDAGKEVLSRARAIMAEVRGGEDALAQLGGVVGSQLKVAVISAGNYFLPGLLAAFQKRNDRLQIELKVNNRDELLRNLTENMTDLAVMGRPPRVADLTSAAFAPHPYVMVAAPGHRLARWRKIPWPEIAEEHIILRERGSDTRATYEEMIGERGKSAAESMEIASNETIKQSVIAGMGISFLSLHTLSLELQLGRLAILDIEGFPVQRHWHVVHHTRKRLPPAAQSFKAFLLSDGESLMNDLVG